MKFYVKFTGKFKDLIPQGWKFQKLFAGCQRIYRKTEDGSDYGPTLRIYQHLGGYLEIDDLFGCSYLIVKQIQEGKLNEWYQDQHPLYASSKNFYPLHLDTKNRIVYTYNSSEMISFINRRYNLELPKLPMEERRNIREYLLNLWTIKMIEDLLERKQIEIVEDKRKYRGNV